MKLGPVTTSYALDNNSWLASAHGLDQPETITVDASKGFVLATHAVNGFLPSGTPLGKVTASGFYGLYDNAASDGREVFQGFLYGGLDGFTNLTDKHGAAGLFDNIKVRESKLPFALGDATAIAAAKVDVAGRIRFLP